MIVLVIAPLALLITAATLSPAVAQTGVEPPGIKLLADPFGRDAPVADGRLPAIRPDPMPAYQELPSRWKLMQQSVCQPLLDPQTGKTTAWQCRMADGTTEVIR